ncbi:MAG: hypothetical protein ACF8NJ_06455, partial [Phycisphaerales bacterium JB038]
HVYGIGVRLHNSDRRSQATPWLELAVMMDPNNEEFRSGLQKNIALTRGAAEASRVADPGYIPSIDDSTLVAEARNAHHDLIRAIFDGGRIDFEGATLFDPADPPSWVRTTFPDILPPS